MLVYLRQFFLSVHFLVVQLVPPILVFRLVICKFSHFFPLQQPPTIAYLCAFSFLVL